MQKDRNHTVRRTRDWVILVLVMWALELQRSLPLHVSGIPILCALCVVPRNPVFVPNLKCNDFFWWVFQILRLAVEELCLHLPGSLRKWHLLGLPMHVLHGKTQLSEDVRLGTVIPEWCLVVPVRLNSSWSLQLFLSVLWKACMCTYRSWSWLSFLFVRRSKEDKVVLGPTKTIREEGLSLKVYKIYFLLLPGDS